MEGRGGVSLPRKGLGIMFTCEMTGCDDMATHEVEFGSGDLLTVCNDCADYFRGLELETVHIKKFAGLL